MSNTAVAFHPAAVSALPAQLTGVSKRYGETVALHGLDLTIRPGELVSLLGANGAGKTTAVRIVLGLASPNEGTATVFGGNPRDAATRTRVGAVLQSARVPETLRVAEHIHLFSSYYPNPMPLGEVIEAAGLAGLERRMFGKLSGGQQKKVLFALAICGNPDLLILDEPTAGLDVEARRALWKQIRLFVERGKSILLTTHYLAEAEALANRVVVINKGRVVAEGTPHEVKGDAATLEDAFIEMMSA
jgi:ABC-2 type transport system ATP-binding protein